jgi:hypothetical protein
MSWGEWKINRRDMLRLSFGTAAILGLALQPSGLLPWS